MSKLLTEYLTSIGQELHDTMYTDETGTIRPITKDEQLAREIWKRALGHTNNDANADGNKSQRIFPPDPKAQQFIFERREGKFVTPIEERSISLLQRIDEITRNQMNEVAEQIVDDSSTPHSDT